MRIIDIPKVERRSCNFEISKSSDFISDVVGQPKRIHYMSRDGISLPKIKIEWNKWLEARIEQLPKHERGSARAEMREKIRSEKIKPTSTVSRFVMALHNAFDKHIPFALSPETVMTIISQEIAQYVKDHSDEAGIASLFTTTPNEKQKINVEVDHFVYEQDNPWLEGVVQFRDKLIETVPSNVLEYMLPKFSNTSLEIEVAHLISFMDAASKYYSYSMSTCCGIPSFKIEGTSDDWNKIIQSAQKLSEVLPGLKDYFNNLIPTLSEIRNTVDGNKVDYEFWHSIYKLNGGSGGPFSNGWFNNFYAHLYMEDWKTKKQSAHLKDVHFNRRMLGGTKLNQFPSNISRVPFAWLYYNTEIPMTFVAGVSSVELIDDYLTPKIGVAILENEKEQTT